MQSSTWDEMYRAVYDLYTKSILLDEELRLRLADTLDRLIDMKDSGMVWGTPSQPPTVTP